MRKRKSTEEEPPAPPVKRGRGRPPKNASSKAVPKQPQQKVEAPNKAKVVVEEKSAPPDKRPTREKSKRILANQKTAPPKTSTTKVTAVENKIPDESTEVDEKSSDDEVAKKDFSVKAKSNDVVVEKRKRGRKPKMPAIVSDGHHDADKDENEVKTKAAKEMSASKSSSKLQKELGKAVAAAPKKTPNVRRKSGDKTKASGDHDELPHSPAVPNDHKSERPSQNRFFEKPFFIHLIDHTYCKFPMELLNFDVCKVNHIDEAITMDTGEDSLSLGAEASTIKRNLVEPSNIEIKNVIIGEGHGELAALVASKDQSQVPLQPQQQIHVAMVHDIPHDSLISDMMEIEHTETDIPEDIMKSGGGQAMENGSLCVICGLEYHDTNVLQAHQRLHNGKDVAPPFPCDFCTKMFSTKHQWESHCKGHAKAFPCSHCEKTFPTKKSCDVHAASAHKKQPAVVVELKCEVCGHNFAGAAALAQHAKTHQNAKEPPGIEELETTVCELCNKNFATPQSYNTHYKRFHGENTSFPCEVCGKTFKQQIDLHYHSVTRHISEANKPYHCEKCGKAFVQKHAFEQHRLGHDASKLYKCNGCSEKFDAKKQLNDHELTCAKLVKSVSRVGRVRKESQKLLENADKVTGGHQCVECNATFRSKAALAKHELTHSVVPSAKEYKCDVCGEVLKDQTQLNAHKKSHKKTAEHSCETCGKEFQYPSQLKLHAKAHGGTKKKAEKDNKGPPPANAKSQRTKRRR